MCIRDSAKGVLINVTGSIDIGLEEVEQAASLVQAAVHPDALTIFGATFDETLDDEIRVTVIATGFDKGPGELPRKMSDGTREAAPAPGEEHKAQTAAPEPLTEEDLPKPCLLYTSGKPGRFPFPLFFSTPSNRGNSLHPRICWGGGISERGSYSATGTAPAVRIRSLASVEVAKSKNA